MNTLDPRRRSSRQGKYAAAAVASFWRRNMYSVMILMCFDLSFVSAQCDYHT